MTEAETTEAVLSLEEINIKAERLITRCAWGSAGLGIVPIPFIDVIAIGGLQVWLIRELAKLYGLPFTESRTKALVSGLIGGGTPSILASAVVPLIKAVPAVGPFLSIAVAPGLSGAATLAVGRVFNAHFLAGGTLLDFDVEKTRAYYEAEFAKAKTKGKGSKTVEVAPAAV